MMKCKIIFNPSSIPTFEDFEKIEEFEYDNTFELLKKVYQPPGNVCWALNCESGKLYRSENNVFCELGTIKTKTKEMTNRKYTAILRVNNDRTIEVEGLQGPFSCEFIGSISESKNLEVDKNHCCDECLLDDEEITKDLMLDEVISSQHLEIERLMKIIAELVKTNTKLVEIIGRS